MLDGAARVDELVAKAAADGQPALGITDHGNMYGVLDFYQACRDAGRQAGHRHRGRTWPTSTAPSARRAAAGSTTRAATPRAAARPTTTSPLLAENDDRLPQPHPAREPGLPRGLLHKPRVDWELLERPPRGLIATTGCLGGHVLQSLLQGRRGGRARTRPARLQDIFGRDNLFVELQDHGIPDAAPHQPEADRDRPQASARRCSPPTTATTPIARTTRPTTRCCACRPARS